MHFFLCLSLILGLKFSVSSPFFYDYSKRSKGLLFHTYSSCGERFLLFKFKRVNSGNRKRVRKWELDDFWFYFNRGFFFPSTEQHEQDDFWYSQILEWVHRGSVHRHNRGNGRPSKTIFIMKIFGIGEYCDWRRFISHIFCQRKHRCNKFYSSRFGK